MEKITRRLFLRNTAAAGAVGATVVAPAVAEAAINRGKASPEERIAAAVAEIEAAMRERNPDWHIHVRSEIKRIGRHGRNGFEDGPEHANVVLIYASDDDDPRYCKVHEIIHRDYEKMRRDGIA